MLAEIFMLRLEAVMRNDGQTCSSSDKRFVPIRLPLTRTKGLQAALTKSRP